jgi:hypothetical protein
MTDRLVIWEGIDAKRWEVARVELAPHGVRAEGAQVGIDPVPYRLDAASGFVTRGLEVRAAGRGGAAGCAWSTTGTVAWFGPGSTRTGAGTAPRHHAAGRERDEAA